MSATVWRIDAVAHTFEVNGGPDDDGVECWGNIPEGWEAAEATTEWDQLVSDDGVSTYGQRRGGRMLVARFKLIAPTPTLRWAREDQVEAAHDELVTDTGLLIVDQPGQFKGLDVLSHRMPTIRNRRATSFTVTWPLLAPDPNKFNYP